MPLYEYQCKKCKHRFEQIQKFSDKPVKKCPKCGGPVEKLISTSAVQFKGSGWYVSDYGRKGSAGQSSSSSSETDGGSKESKDSKDSPKDSKDTKETKDSKKDDKPKSDSSNKKQKKD